MERDLKTLTRRLEQRKQLSPDWEKDNDAVALDHCIRHLELIEGLAALAHVNNCNMQVTLAETALRIIRMAALEKERVD